MKPDWKDAPEWAEWLAQDMDGHWWFYERRPEEGLTRWSSFGRCEIANRPAQANDWNTSLESRP